MVDHVLSRVGWEGDRFLVYRCLVEYPVMPSTIMIRYELPEKHAKSK